MPEPLALYLRLTPEFGGTRFGPFEQHEVALGSSQDNNHIVLPENLGVASSHVKVYRQDDVGIIVAPVERTASVFVWQGRATRPKQINTNIAVRAGDSFSLVTAQGPRFIIELDKLPEEVIAKRERMKRLPPGARRLTGKAFKEEGRRQAWVAALTTGPGQIAQRAYTFVVSGAIFMPRNIIMIMGVGAGYVFGGATMCSNFSLKDKLASQEKKVDQLSEQNAVLDEISGKGITELRYEDLAQQITRSTALAAALKDDPALLSTVKKKARVIFANSDPYEWLVNPKSGRARRNQAFVRFREGIVGNDDIDGDTALLLPYAAAIGDLSQEDFTTLVDSEGEDVCGYGPMGLTYRQAKNLGLNVALDAYLQGTTSEYEGEGSQNTRRAAFQVTANAAGMSPEAFDEAVDGESEIKVLDRGRAHCLHMSTEDDRNSVNRLVTSLAKNLSDDGLGLPSADNNMGVTARIAKLFVADWTRVDFSDSRAPGFDLTTAPPSVVMEDAGPRGQWVIDQTANVIARSMVLPCVSVLEHNQDGDIAAVFGEPLPSPVYCLVLKWKLDNEG